MYGSTRDDGRSIGRKRETGMDKRTLVKAADVDQQRTAGGANAAVQMPVGPNGAVLLQHYALQLRTKQRTGFVPRQDAILMLYYMMRSLRCTLQSCLVLYGFWRSTGESLDGGGEDRSKPPTGGVLAQSPCQVDPGSVRDKEELKQRSDEEVDDPQGDRDHVMEWSQKDSRLRPCVPCCVANDVQYSTLRYL
ncbi:hypothetical protein LB506_000394 [Fusarium annulatum]|nr:hypothetical protein LB506_000394 [Fusarium annulatum]